MTTTVTVEENNINVTLSDGVVPSSAQLALLQTLAGLAGLANFNGSGSASAIKINLSATAAPTSGDDTGDGYTVGSLWADTSNDKAYICLDATLGAAVWTEITGGGGGAVDVTDLTTTTGNPAEMVRVAGAGGLEYRTVAQVLADLRDSGALATPDLGVTVQGYDADLAAIAALSPSNDDVVQRKAGAWTNRTMAQVMVDLGAAALRPPQTDIAGTTHTFTTANEGQIVASQSGSATVFTVPLNSSQAFTVGAIVGIERQGAGTLAITATSGVTLNGVDGASKSISTQWAAAALRKVGTNAWVIIGAIS